MSGKTWCCGCVVSAAVVMGGVRSCLVPRLIFTPLLSGVPPVISDPSLVGCRWETSMVVRPGDP
jgi:hypothetical protein